jgi:hypothetical protein
MKKISSTFLHLAVMSFLTLDSTKSYSQDYENTCRIKAKEVATKTYTNCVGEYKTTQLEKIKKDYQVQLKTLKDKYEAELLKLGGQPKALSSEILPAQISSSKSKKQSKTRSKENSEMPFDGGPAVKLQPQKAQKYSEIETEELPEAEPAENL